MSKVCICVQAVPAGVYEGTRHRNTFLGGRCARGKIGNAGIYKLLTLSVTKHMGQVFILLIRCDTMRAQAPVSSADIELETGLGKDQLRKWRERFGFPPLDAVANGRPAYARQTVKQLLLIKRLLEGGYRPAQVVGMTPVQLDKLCKGLAHPVPVANQNANIHLLMDHLKRADMVGLRAALVAARARGLLSEFVANTLGPLITEVGNAWSRNELDIYQEHLCTSVIERQLHAEILGCRPRAGLPCVLLALPPGENHMLGLLMIEAVLAAKGASVVNMGSNVPLNNLKLAALAFHSDVLALSFSFSYPARDALPTLLHLRRLLPARIQIWAGGAGLARIRKQPRGVRIFLDIEEAVVALQEWTLQHPVETPPA